MVICVCNNISDSEIKKAIDDKIDKEDFQNDTGCSLNCGSCQFKLDRLYGDDNE